MLPFAIFKLPYNYTSKKKRSLEGFYCVFLSHREWKTISGARCYVSSNHTIKHKYIKIQWYKKGQGSNQTTSVTLIHSVRKYPNIL